MTNSKRGGRTPRRSWLIAALAILAASVVVGVLLVGDGDTNARSGAKAGNAGVDVNPNGTSSPVTPSGGAAPAVGERSEADAYRAAIVACNSEIAQQLDALTRQLVNAQYSESTWKTETTDVLDQMARTADKARGIQPTPEFQESHAVWLEGIESYDWVAENMVTAITVPDDELLIQCTERLALASAKFKEATDLVARVSVD